MIECKGQITNEQHGLLKVYLKVIDPLGIAVFAAGLFLCIYGVFYLRTIRAERIPISWEGFNQYLEGFEYHGAVAVTIVFVILGYFSGSYFHSRNYLKQKISFDGARVIFQRQNLFGVKRIGIPYIQISHIIFQNKRDLSLLYNTGEGFWESIGPRGETLLVLRGNYNHIVDLIENIYSANPRMGFKFYNWWGNGIQQISKKEFYERIELAIDVRMGESRER